jgi:hypothetical protein
MNAPYQATESEGFVTVTFGVICGRLEREMAVELSFLDGTAVGESLKFPSCRTKTLMGKEKPCFSCHAETCCVVLFCVIYVIIIFCSWV